MAYLKWTLGQLVTIDSDADQRNIQAGGGWTFFDEESEKDDGSFDSTSQEWGTFEPGDTVKMYSDNGQVQRDGEFVGTQT